MNKYGDHAIIEKVKAQAEAEGTPLSDAAIQLMENIIDLEGESYTEGYMQGYMKGHTEGWDEGYDEGYNYGKAARV